MSLYKDSLKVLKETSRTFFIPITHLSDELKEAVTSAYLCMRAIDEIEDHPELPKEDKIYLLTSISEWIEKGDGHEALTELLHPYKNKLPEVSLRLYDWVKLCPSDVTPKILEATSIMAKGMAKWVKKEWDIKSEQDLDDYTYYVAGLVGVMLSDLWEWYDNTETDKELAIAFGRGLQSVNILRNVDEDKARGVNFFPDGWELADMFSYSQKNLALADQYIKSIKTREILDFCKIPLALAHGTLKTLIDGNEKLTRADVTEIVNDVVSK